MNRERFRQLVAEALNEIPEPFSSRLNNVEVVVEDAPSSSAAAGLREGRDMLFGLYEGIPLHERAGLDGVALPDRITIFYRPLVRAFRTPAAIRREVRKTVIHEIGHFFGLDDEEMEQAGY